PLVDADLDLALDVLAGLLEEGVERLAQLGEPEAVVGELGVLLGEPRLEEDELLERALRAVEHRRRRLLVDLAHLDADEPVLHGHEAPDAVRAGALVQALEERDRRELLA